MSPFHTLDRTFSVYVLSMLVDSFFIFNELNDTTFKFTFPPQSRIILIVTRSPQLNNGKISFTFTVFPSFVSEILRPGSRDVILLLWFVKDLQFFFLYWNSPTFLKCIFGQVKFHFTSKYRPIVFILWPLLVFVPKSSTSDLFFWEWLSLSTLSTYLHLDVCFSTNFFLISV